MLFRIPIDILLKILLECNLESVLSIESTCKELRDLSIGDRHHWLSRLRKLGRACAPDLPRHVDVSTLTSKQLRELVVRAVWKYQDFRYGAPEKHDSNYKTFEYYGEFHWEKPFEYVLLPGGRFLVSWSPFGPSPELQLWNIDQKPRLVWSPSGDIKLDRDLIVAAYLECDQSIIVWLSESRSSNFLSMNNDLLAFRLTTCLDDSFQAQTVYQGRYEELKPSLLLCNDLFALAVFKFGVRIVCLHNCWETELELAHEIPETMKLHGELLIYPTCIQVEDGTEAFAMHAIPLRTLFSVDKRRVVIGEDVFSSTVNLVAPSGSRILHILEYSVCDYSWTGENRSPVMTVYAKLWHRGLGKNSIMAWDITISASGQLLLQREFAPVICPPEVWGTKFRFPTPASARLFSVTNNPDPDPEAIVLLPCHIGVDDDDRIFVNCLDHDLYGYDARGSVRPNPSIDFIASSSGDMIRIDKSDLCSRKTTGIFKFVT